MGIRVLAAIGLSLFVLGCTKADPVTDAAVDLGDFRLGHNVVVTKAAKKIGPSRTATPEEWEELLEGAIAARFDKYQGEKLYHLGVHLDGYALAVPGVPVVLSPKSALVISINVWDDAAAAKLNEEPRQITVFEQLDGGTILGSGLTRGRDEQMKNLSIQMAAAIERYLLANAEWFGASADEEAKAAAEADVLKLPDGSTPDAPPSTNQIPQPRPAN